MSKRTNLARVWAEVEDCLVPYFRLDAHERALYYHLLRHTRVVGRRTVFISKRGLTISACLSITTIINRLRGLARKGCIRIVERSYEGHRIEVLVPGEIPGCVRREEKEAGPNLEAANCIKNPRLRRAIFRREGGRCFYCLRRLGPRMASMDHVVPLAEGGDHSYRNVVACCFHCNTSKLAQPAREFLRSLAREGMLNRRELPGRRRALEALQRGRAKPRIEGSAIGALVRGAWPAT